MCVPPQNNVGAPWAYSRRLGRHSPPSSKRLAYRFSPHTARASLRGAERRGNLREPGLSFTGSELGVLTGFVPMFGKPGSRRLPRRSVMPVPALMCFEPETRLATGRFTASTTPRNDVLPGWVVGTRGVCAATEQRGAAMGVLAAPGPVLPSYVEARRPPFSAASSKSVIARSSATQQSTRTGAFVRRI